MLEFNINGRLINLRKDVEQTPEQRKLIPQIEKLLILQSHGFDGWSVASKLSKLFMQYDPWLNIGGISTEFLEHYLSLNKYLLDGKRVSSLPEDAFYCNVCNEWHSKKHTNENILDGDGTHVCDRALKDDVYTCSNCHKKFVSLYDSFSGLCKECYEETQKYRIKRYHDNPPLKFYNENGLTSDNNGEFYGLELEVDKGGERNDISKDVVKLLNERVYTMHDGSLSNGFEIITQPHTEKALYDLNWKETFKWLIHKGYRSHDISTCGLHLHINRSVFKANNALTKMIYFYENNFNEILKVSRRDKGRADRWAGKYDYRDKIDMYDAFSILSQYDRMGEHSWRYKCVNLQKRNTVEIRIMRGTLNYNSFMACLDFMITVAKNSNKVKNVDSWEEWLDGISDNTKQYLSARRAFGYPPQEQDIEDDCYNMTNEEIRNMEEIVCAL